MKILHAMKPMAILHNIENDLKTEKWMIQTNSFCVYFSGVFWCSFNESNRRNGVHSHNVYELCICLDGRGQFVCGDKSYELTKNSAFVGPPNISHEIIMAQNDVLELMYFTFSIERIGNTNMSESDVILNSFIENGNIICPGNEHLNLYSDLLKRYSLLGGKFGMRNLLEALFFDSILCLSHQNQLSNKNASFNDSILNYINANCQEHISAEDLCRLLKMSQRSLYYYFKRNFGSTPLNYINAIKMSKAAGYLNMGFSVKNTAEKIGFFDVPSFCRLFKHHYKMTPTEYKNQVWHQKQ